MDFASVSEYYTHFMKLTNELSNITKEKRISYSKKTKFKVYFSRYEREESEAFSQSEEIFLVHKNETKMKFQRF